MRKKSAYAPYGGRKKRVWLRALLCLVLAAVLLFAALEVYIGVHSRTRSADGPQPAVMVIFGCQMKKEGPSVLLRDRLDTALDYWRDHPGIKIIVTGGKGDDEHLSEAQGMYDYLTAHGVDGASIYREDRSHNTWENVNNTLDLMGEVGMALHPDTGETEGMDPGGVLLVSSGFHLARIKLLWARAGGSGDVSTLAAPVSHTPSRIQMFFREPLALVKSFLFDR